MSTPEAITSIDHIVGGIHRISTFMPDYGITMNQFLIDDERPALIHTGEYYLYDAVCKAVGEVLDPAKLEFVALLHFESDECGGMHRFVAGAPDSTLVGSALSAGLNLAGWEFEGKVQGFAEGETLDLGRHKLRFLETPHVHHWDSMMIFEETTKSLFPADLYIQPGEQPAVSDDNLGDMGCELYRGAGIFAHEQPVRDVVERVQALEPEWCHAMHGATLTGSAMRSYSQTLRDQDFAYQGMLLGRQIV